MRTTPLLLAALLLCQTLAVAQSTITVNPKNIQHGEYLHAELAPALLQRIRATTDVFEKIDGIYFEQAVDMYRRDLNPEKELVIWEEMAKAYLAFCKLRCATDNERKDVYQALLLHTMYSESQAVQRATPKVLSMTEVLTVVKLYRLSERPIEVLQKK